jgi:hypothetical protein
MKVRVDLDSELAGRIASVQRGTFDPRRTFRAIGEGVNSSNIVVEASDTST